MGNSSPEKRPTGETVLIIEVPEAEPSADRWRRRFDSSAPDGIPAHITVISPFLHTNRLDEATLDELRALFAAHDAFDLSFNGFGHFPNVLYLAPTPAAPLVALIEAVAARWPEAPPYAGEYDEIKPHLTLANDQDPDAYAEVEFDIAAKLPITARVTSAHLLAFDGERWQERETFPLRDQGSTSAE